MTDNKGAPELAPALLIQLGLQPERVNDITLLHARHGHRLYRLRYAATSFVLKWFPVANDVELQSYALLRAHNIPTLPVHGCAEQAILLEDLLTSPAWRLAAPEDMARAETGSAVAGWYRRLHAAGRQIMAAPTPPPAFLRRESDALSAPGILAMGQRLHMPKHPVWQLAAEHLAALQAALRTLDQTLNYNDFYWTNLALSRTSSTLRAVVYDYHLLGIGLRYSDCRNVIGSLSGAARPAFWEAYGPVDEREALLDAPLSALYSLWVASQRPSLPAWSRDILRQVQDGQLERDLRAALEII